jgi:tetratricopeptide (TPR) repeat protein
MPSLCLNMIVRNESKIITRLLESVSAVIDSYCICDTGSTDDTVQIIKSFFAEKQIPGKIVVEPFKDFGHNRSFALKACNGMDNADYILLLDADMIFWRNPNISVQEFKTKLEADVYLVYQGTECFFYKNVRIVKNRTDFSYWGVTHEYLNTPPNVINSQLARDYCFINDIGDGGCKTDKFLRDIKLLTKGLEEVPNNDRYTFYLANSYRDAGQYEKAIETYKKRIEIGGWVEEIWHSYFSIGRCYKFMNDWPNAIYYWLEAYNYYPKRIENLYEIIQYYRNHGKNELAYTFYKIADIQRKKHTSWDYLFLQKDVYDYKIDYELSIFGYYCNPDSIDLAKTCMKVLAYTSIEAGISKNVLSNYKFYAKEISKIGFAQNANMALLQTIGKTKMSIFPQFVSSTPSICYNNNGISVCVRYVNYKINDEGRYINQNYIETKNVIANINIQNSEWTITDEYVLDYDKTHDNVYVGLEDIRLFTTTSDPNILNYIANRGLGSSNIVVEMGKIQESRQSTDTPCQFLHYPDQTSVEKNWAIFEACDNTIKCIYKWFPLTIGDIQNGEFSTLCTVETPNFFKFMRGSTPGVVVNDEIWFINHIVSYEDRRYYYHCIVVLDAKTYKLKKYTPLWTFEKSKVEYTLGFIYMPHSKSIPNDQFMIGYSIMDRETKYMSISKNIFDNMMIYRV